MMVLDKLEDCLAAAHERREAKRGNAGDGERYGKAGIRYVALYAAVELLLREEHALVVQAAGDTAEDAEQYEEQIMTVREISNEGQA